MNREDDSVQVDSYLDALLSRRAAPADDLADIAADEPRATEMRVAATLVQRTLPRFHPSFAFEERLAGRLRSPDRMSPGVVLPFAPHPSVDAHPSAGPNSPAQPPTSIAAAAAGGTDRRTRGVLLGGAIASGVSIAGVSIAGAALLARRRARPTVSAL